MRIITMLLIHCSAVMPNQTSSADQIDLWHRQRGWNGIGYHYVIRRDGSVENGRPIERIGAHCKNHNRHSIGICYEGGLDDNGRPADTRTPEQKAAMERLISELKHQFPNAIVLGHHDLNPDKACPCCDTSQYRRANRD